MLIIAWASAECFGFNFPLSILKLVYIGERGPASYRHSTHTETQKGNYNAFALQIEGKQPPFRHFILPVPKKACLYKEQQEMIGAPCAICFFSHLRDYISCSNKHQ